MEDPRYTSNALIRMEEDKRYLNVREACLYLSMSRWTLYDLAGKGEIPPIKIGRKLLRFDKNDINKFMEKKKIKNMKARLSAQEALAAG